MKKFKIRAVLFTALLLAAGLLLTGCPQKVKEPPKPVYYAVTLEHAGGTITASPALQGGKALKNSEITFTASPSNPSTHEVDKWTVTGGETIEGGTDGSTSVKVKITKDTTVKVTFKEKPKYMVSIITPHPSDGTLTADSHISHDVYKGTEIIFTATPANPLTHQVDKWTVTGGQVIEGGNTGSTNVKVRITANTTVKVTFKEKPGTIPFVQIPQASIVGKNPTYPLHQDNAGYKGVFIEGRKVTLSGYALAKTEVPYWLWKEVYDWAVKPENGYKFANKGREGTAGTDGAAHTEAGKNEPVTNVSWRDCIVWCNAYTQKQNNSDSECVYRKSKSDHAVLKDATDGTACDAAYFDKSKKGYRLPTEAEWEYAARWQGTDETNAENYGGVWLTKLWS